MNMPKPSNDLFDLKTEIEAVAILRELLLELKYDAKSSTSFERASTACEVLCKIGQAPNNYLGMELIKLLQRPYDATPNEISMLVNAFVFNITTQIDFLRMSLSENQKTD